jgi:hypothetical protein
MRYYATKLTADNLDEMIELGAQHEFTLDHLQDQMEFNADFGWDTYLTMQTDDRDKVLTFNDIPSIEFDGTWQFGTDTTGPLTQIVRI